MKNLIILFALGLFIFNSGKGQMCFQQSCLNPEEKIGLDKISENPIDKALNRSYYKHRHGYHRNRNQSIFNYGIKAGVNLANVHMNYSDEHFESAIKFHLGYSVGCMAEIPISDYFLFQPGLMFSSKGFNFKEDIVEEDQYSVVETKENDRMSYNYIEIPIHVAFQTNVLQLITGPYVAFGVGGNYITDYEMNYTFNIMGITYSGTESDHDSGKLTSGTDYNFFDYGMDFGAGVRVGNFVISSIYSLGLGNIFNTFDSDYEPGDFKICNRVINLSLTYYFINN